MASLVETLLGAQSPVTQWTQRNSNLLTGLGTSLLSDGMNFQPAQVGATLDRQAAAQKEADAKLAASTNATKQWLAQNYPDLAQAVDAGLPVSDAWQEAFKRKNSQTGAGDFTTGFTPVWGTYEGQPATVLPGNDGQFYLNGKPIDPAKFVPTNPYDLNAQKAGGTAFGKLTGGAQFTVPNAQEEMDQSLAATAKLGEADVKAGMEDWFKQWGMFPRGAWVQGGTNMANFRNTANNIIDRSWLSARDALKGGGQITDYEGQKAENAVSMMKTALESGDKSSYEQAVRDYEYWIQRGFEKLLQQAGSLPGGFGAPQQGGNIPTVADQAGYDALPSGSQYVAPDGTTRTKP